MSSAINNTAADSDQEGIEIDYEEISRRDAEQFYAGTSFQATRGNDEESLLTRCIRFISQVVQEVTNEGTAPELLANFSLADIEQGRALNLRPLTELTRTSIEFSVEQRTYEYNDVVGGSEENSMYIFGDDAEWPDSELSTDIELAQVQEPASPAATVVIEPNIELAQVQEPASPAATVVIEPNIPLVLRCKFSKRLNSRPEDTYPNVESVRVLDAAKIRRARLETALKNRPFTTAKQPDPPVHLTRELSKRVNSKPPNAGPGKMSKSVLDAADVPPCCLGMALKKWPFKTK